MGSLESGERADLIVLADRLERSIGRPVFSDQSRVALQNPHAEEPLIVTRRDESGELVAFALLSKVSVGWTLDIVGPDELIWSGAVGPLVDEAITTLARSIDAPTELTWWRESAGTTDGVEAELGFGLQRELLQMRRDLPTGAPVTIDTRPFEVGVDEHAFLQVNNRAFAGHHEQSGWTLDTIELREAEPWFDPDGFRLHERDGRLAGFCWTKIHDPVLDSAETRRFGEIYVIAVDPDFVGLGLGKQLTLAGLEWLADRGIVHGMLYVDADNRTAVNLYERLGFRTHSSNRAYVRHVKEIPS